MHVFDASTIKENHKKNAKSLHRDKWKKELKVGKKKYKEKHQHCHWNKHTKIDFFIVNWEQQYEEICCHVNLTKKSEKMNKRRISDLKGFLFQKGLLFLNNFGMPTLKMFSIGRYFFFDKWNLQSMVKYSRYANWTIN